jgi:aspartyl-tRNA(Asn)/glutamyl-tRNA(Gln) amidotransferase subunit A
MERMRGSLRTPFRRRFDRVFDEVDLWVCPTTPMTAFPHRRTGRAFDIDGHRVSYGQALGMYTCTIAAAATPALSLPIGMVSGLPTAAQLVMRQGRDRALIASARRIEALLRS